MNIFSPSKVSSYEEDPQGKGPPMDPKRRGSEGTDELLVSTQGLPVPQMAPGHRGIFSRKACTGAAYRVRLHLPSWQIHHGGSDVSAFQTQLRRAAEVGRPRRYG